MRDVNMPAYTRGTLERVLLQGEFFVLMARTPPRKGEGSMYAFVSEEESMAETHLGYLSRDADTVLAIPMRYDGATPTKESYSDTDEAIRTGSEAHMAQWCAYDHAVRHGQCNMQLKINWVVQLLKKWVAPEAWKTHVLPWAPDDGGGFVGARAHATMMLTMLSLEVPHVC